MHSDKRSKSSDHVRTMCDPHSSPLLQTWTSCKAEWKCFSSFSKQWLNTLQMKVHTFLSFNFSDWFSTNINASRRPNILTPNKITPVQRTWVRSENVNLHCQLDYESHWFGPKSPYSSVCMYLFGNNIAHMSKAGYGAIYKGLVFPYKFDLWP